MVCEVAFWSYVHKGALYLISMSRGLCVGLLAGWLYYFMCLVIAIASAPWKMPPALFSVIPRVPIQQRLVITIATAACGALCTLRNKALALKKKITHTLICYMKFYFMLFTKGIVPPTKPAYLPHWTLGSRLLYSLPTPMAL